MTVRPFPVPTGQISARVHGARRQLMELRGSALDAAARADERGQVEFAASLRGKAQAYFEAATIVDSLERGYRLPRWYPQSRFRKHDRTAREQKR